MLNRAAVQILKTFCLQRLHMVSDLNFMQKKKRDVRIAFQHQKNIWTMTNVLAKMTL